MAAQPLVRASYVDPVQTYATNVMGTVHLLEAVRRADCVRAVVIVTTDKCYENLGWPWGYREIDVLGGHDPYSNSKGCAELVVSAYRKSFFEDSSAPAIASARAGNVIGGGDWAEDRLVPDAIRAFGDNQTLNVRYPDAVRPWQHVLDPLIGYMLLAEHLIKIGSRFSEAWNFGPDSASEVSVRTVVEALAAQWGNGAKWQSEPSGSGPHEAAYLKLDCSKARLNLGWRPLIEFDRAIELTADWYRALKKSVAMRQFSVKQIGDVLNMRFQ